MLFRDPLGGRSTNRWDKLTDECRTRLTRQQISLEGPGSILKDVNTVLDFVGQSGIPTQSDNASLPSQRLPELNLKMGHPINLVLKRPLLRDYPNLAGIFVLLRVMDLLQADGKRLAVCPNALAFWRRLNPTEQYFALLEALLFQAHSSVLAAGRTREDAQCFEMVTIFLGQLSEQWLQFESYESTSLFGPKGQVPPWNLFAQQQLGLIELRPRQVSETERKPYGGRGWLAGSARLTPWGTAVTCALRDFRLQELQAAAELDPDEENDGAAAQQLGLANGVLLPRSEPGAQEQDQGLGPDEPTEGESGPHEAQDEAVVDAEFGILQPVFQPYFPEWRTAYARPQREARAGTHTFKVSLTGWRGDHNVWRRLAVPPNSSLDGLAGAILRAFKFDDDHLYDFRYRDQRGRSRIYNHPATDDPPFTTDIAVGQTDLAIRDSMLFTFDYGDDWKFDVRLEAVEAEPSRLRQAKVVESAGKAPEQYPNAEW